MTTSSGSIPPPSSLSYTGEVVVPFISKPFPPQSTFTTFPVPTVWIDHLQKNAYIQVAKPLGVAYWVHIGGVPGEVDTITTPDSVVVVPSSGNINFLNGIGMNITGAGSSITFNSSGSVPTTFDADSGTATPAINILNVFGTSAQGISTSGSGNTLTITAADWTTTQKGVGTLATNAETVAGTVTNKAVTPDDLKAKLGTQILHGLPIGEGTTAALTWTAAPTNGQLLIGSTGADPALGTITSTDGSIVVTLGAGTINIEADSTAGNVRFSARKSANSTNATGDGTVFTIVCDTVIQNIGSGYNGGTGVFTAPVTGLYYFTCIVDLTGIGAAHTIGLVDFAGHSFDSNPFNMATSSSTSESLSYSQVMLLNATDTVSLDTAVAGGTKTITVQGGSTNKGCFFSGFLIG